MAISYVNSNYITVTTGDATWDFTLPAGSQAGDYVLIFNVTDNVTVSDAGDCTALELVAVTANSNRARMYYKVLDAADISAGVITHTFNTTTAGVGVIAGFRNVKSIYSDNSLLSETAGTTISTTAISAIPTGSTAIACFVSLDTVDTVTHSQPSGYTEIQDRNVTSSPNKSMSVCYKLTASSSENPSSTASATVDQKVGFLAILGSDVGSNGSMLQFSF